jgi:L-lactate dehydrogenase complex protein LldG
MSERDAFLARVREAARQGRHYRVPLQPVPESVGYVGASGDPCERLAEEVNAVGGEALIVPDLAAARLPLRRLLESAGATTAVLWQHPVLERLGLAEWLPLAGVTPCNYDRLAALPLAEQRTMLLGCDVGITSCDCAIAESGTLMICSQPGQERVASLLPPMHIAIVERQQIVPDLIDAFQLLAERAPTRLPSNVTWITGPSKTGDIELQLTTGVHGPGKWRVLIVR